MNSYIFHGLVLPERVNASISQGKYTYDQEKIEIILECHYSKIIAACSCDNLDINVLTLKNYVGRTARILVDAVGYTLACGYDIEIESAYNTNTNEWYIFGVDEPIFDDSNVIKKVCDGIPHPDISISAGEIAKLSGANIELQIALGDFREAILQPNFTSFHCYRAIEALKHAFTGNEKKQWEELRRVLNIDRKEIDLVRKGAASLRHGQYTAQTWELRKRHMLITWHIIKKYIDWRSGIAS